MVSAKLNENLSQDVLRVVNLESYPYEMGLAVTAINIEDSDGGTELIVDQMIEPLIMSDKDIVRPGAVLFKEA